MRAAAGAVTPEEGSPWLIRRPQSRSQMRLFCFSHAGGNAAHYLNWQAALSPSIEICGVQLPGRGGRFLERSVEDIAALTQHISAAIDECDRMPFAFFGHSLGALLAYEVLHLRRERGLSMPFHLVASGCGPPHRRASTSGLHLLNDQQLAAKLKGYGASEEFLGNAELMELMLPVLRADFRLVSDYVHRARPVLETPISVFAGVSDTFDSTADYASWAELTRCACRTHWFEGGHFFIESQQNRVLEALSRALELPHAGRPSHPIRSSG